MKYGLFHTDSHVMSCITPKGSTINNNLDLHRSTQFVCCSCIFHGTELEWGRKPWQRNFQQTKKITRHWMHKISTPTFVFSPPPKWQQNDYHELPTNFFALQILAVMLLSKMYSTCAKLEWSGGDRGVTFWGSWKRNGQHFLVSCTLWKCQSSPQLNICQSSNHPISGASC